MISNLFFFVFGVRVSRINISFSATSVGYSRRSLGSVVWLGKVLSFVCAQRRDSDNNAYFPVSGRYMGLVRIQLRRKNLRYCWDLMLRSSQLVNLSILNTVSRTK